MPTVDTRRLIFLDESGLAPGGRLAYGYAPRGERCYEARPLRPKGRINLLGFISVHGGKIVKYKGSVTAKVFEHFVAKHVVPFLERGDIVIWDNARIHSAEAESMIRAAGGEVVPLPPYSPELSAIEPMWGKTKHGVRGARADTSTELDEALEVAAKSITQSDVEGWITHCGYRLNPAA